MRLRARLAIIATVLAAVAGLAWMLRGGNPGELVDRSNVVDAVAGLAALIAAVVVLWPRARRQHTDTTPSTEQLQAVVESLAAETLR